MRDSTGDGFWNPLFVLCLDFVDQEYSSITAQQPIKYLASSLWIPCQGSAVGPPHHCGSNPWPPHETAAAQLSPDRRQLSPIRQSDLGPGFAPHEE